MSDEPCPVHRLHRPLAGSGPTRPSVLGGPTGLLTGGPAAHSDTALYQRVIEVSDSPTPIGTTIINHTIYDSFPEQYASIREDTKMVFVSNDIQEEPIDLTFVRTNRLGDIESQSVPISANPTRILIQPKQEMHLLNMTDPLLSERGCKRKFEIQNLPNEEIIISNWSQTSPPVTIPQTFIIPETHSSQNPQQHTSYSYAIVHPPQQDIATHLTARQQEILKMAKSIFSKRTRTLYHWMYPTASKQQIKQVVSNTWDSMAAQEKNIYIAQVLGRFGYANANLMVNPQLGQIKELPPMPGIEEFNPKASELQNAISSIKNETEILEQPGSSNIQCRKRARVTKKKIAQNLSNACQEFDDDPELSQELAQFSIMFKNQF